MLQTTLRAVFLCAVVAAAAACACAQSSNAPRSADSTSLRSANSPAPRSADATAATDATAKDKGTDAPAKDRGAGAAGGLFGFEEMRRQLREQRDEIDELRAAVREQTRLIGELRTRVERAELQASRQGPTASVRDAAYAPGAREAASAGGASDGSRATVGEASAAERTDDGAASSQNPELENRVARVEERTKKVEEQTKKTSEAVAKQLGSLTFGGDLRLRYESFYGQQNALQSSDNPAALGNPLTTRQRLRLRARFSVRGKITDEFEWGLRLATGSFADAISTNQTLTDFFTRKPFGLDYAYLVYQPKALPGFFVEAGKLDAGRKLVPRGEKDANKKLDAFWTHTELTWDNDLNPEGLMETYARKFEGRAFRSVVLQAWQLPMLERNSAFVLGADGRVDLSASRRAGRDLALYGAQARTEFAPSPHLSLKLSASDLYFSGTQLITPAQVFGANLQLPVTFTIPTSGTTPARTITTQVSVPRDLLVSGNANLGLSLANTNAVNRDGHLSSGYNLVDLIARADFTRSRRWPVMLLFDFVDNTQTHPVVVAGPNGADLALPNHEGQGFWAEFQVGRDVLRPPADGITRGDLTLNYTFIRIERDAILSPFNGSDLGQSTDMSAHRFIFGYALDPRVQVTLTGIFTQRPNGLLGPFAPTPPGSLNRTATRLQLDTILRF
ncbi:MAG: putative porin [Acidobacteriota bacterium]|nr:putative porin [Acidobacteriota bacterium]